MSTLKIHANRKHMQRPPCLQLSEPSSTFSYYLLNHKVFDIWSRHHDLIKNLQVNSVILG